MVTKSSSEPLTWQDVFVVEENTISLEVVGASFDVGTGAGASRRRCDHSQLGC